MKEPDNLMELPLLKHHSADGDRRDLLDYRELDEDDIEGYPRPASEVIR